MKIRSGFTLAVKLIFLLSLCVMLYSAFQILKAPAEAREALRIWDKKREEAQLPVSSEEETPLPEGMVSSAESPTGDKPAYIAGEVIGEIYFPKLKSGSPFWREPDGRSLSGAPDTMRQVPPRAPQATACWPDTVIPSSAVSASWRPETGLSLLQRKELLPMK